MGTRERKGGRELKLSEKIVGLWMDEGFEKTKRRLERLWEQEKEKGGE